MPNNGYMSMPDKSPSRHIAEPLVGIKQNQDYEKILSHTSPFLYN